MNEGNFESKETTEQKLARLLKEKGVQDTEAKAMLDTWTREQEHLVEQAQDHLLEAIYFNLRRARLYFEADYLNEAFEAFDDALLQAENENRAELCQVIQTEMDRLEASLQ